MPSTSFGVDARVCAWSDDGALLAVGTESGVVLWRLGADITLRALGEPGEVDALAFADGGRTLWSAIDREVRCHEIAFRKRVRALAVPRRVAALSIAAGAWIAVDGEQIEVGDLAGGDRIRQLARLDQAPPADPGEWMERGAEACVAVAPNGRTVLAGYADGACWMFALPGAEPRELQKPDECPVSAVAWSPTGDLVLLAGDGRFALHGGPRWKRHRHNTHATSLFERVTAIAFSPRGTEFAVASEYDSIDGTSEDLEFIRVDAVDARSDRKYVQIRDLVQRRHIPSARAAAYDPSGRVLALCKRQGGVSLWDAEARTYLGTLVVLPDRAAGMLVNEPWTVSEDARIELFGDPARLRDLGPSALPRWAADATVSTGRGPLAGTLVRRLGLRTSGR